MQIVGSLVVLSSIVVMTFSDWLESKKCCKRKAEVYDDQDVEVGENNEKLLKEGVKNI